MRTESIDIVDAHMRSLTEVDIAWLAGLLEGEGSFVLLRGRAGTICLWMSDGDVVARAARLLAATVRFDPHLTIPGKPGFVIRKGGLLARRMLIAILPYMGARRSEQIGLLLAAQTWGLPESCSRKKQGECIRGANNPIHRYAVARGPNGKFMQRTV